MNVLYVFIGGGIGSITRYLIGQAFSRTTLELPVATLLANVSACAVFAITLIYLESKTASENSALRMLLLTGFCGGLSTFSTFSYETFLLMKQQNYGWMAANIFISVVLCTSIFIFVKK